MSIFGERELKCSDLRSGSRDLCITSWCYLITEITWMLTFVWFWMNAAVTVISLCLIYCSLFKPKKKSANNLMCIAKVWVSYALFSFFIHQKCIVLAIIMISITIPSISIMILFLFCSAVWLRQLKILSNFVSITVNTRIFFIALSFFFLYLF